MLRARQRNGEVIEMDSSVAIEFVDATGKLAAVVTQSAGGIVNILTPGDPVFNAYANVNAMRPSKVHVHEPFSGKPVK
jgi:hypothetical protein